MGNSRLDWNNPLGVASLILLLHEHKAKRNTFLEWSHSLKTTQSRTITKTYSKICLPHSCMEKLPKNFFKQLVSRDILDAQWSCHTLATWAWVSSWLASPSDDYIITWERGFGRYLRRPLRCRILGWEKSWSQLYTREIWGKHCRAHTSRVIRRWSVSKLSQKLSQLKRV